MIICLLLSVIWGCQESPKSPTNTQVPKDVATDSTAIANTIHGFYQWYDAYVNDNTKQIDFLKVVKNHNTLDLPLLDKYLAKIQSSGFISAEFIANDKAFYQACEKVWQKEEAEGVPTGMDADKYFCAQDWDINFWTKSPVRIKNIGTDKVAATLYGKHGDGSLEHNFELKKENGKWLISKIECDMGVNLSAAVSTEKQSNEALVNELAAFYTGNVSCADCDGIQTTLTLNADPQRSYSLEEEHKGKKTKTVESSGTWTVANNIVTLTGKTGKQQYEVTKEGLISMNADGTKRDVKSASKYLLKKVLGE